MPADKLDMIFLVAPLGFPPRNKHGKHQEQCGFFFNPRQAHDLVSASPPHRSPLSQPSGYILSDSPLPHFSLLLVHHPVTAPFSLCIAELPSLPVPA